MEIERGTLMEEAKNSPQGPALRTWFNALRMAYAGHVLPFNEGAAIRAAQLAGANRPSVDLMIAAIALEFGYAVATRNVAHFNFPGLVVVDPWA
jgi:predicted nucleic acid-binding protein